MGGNTSRDSRVDASNNSKNQHVKRPSSISTETTTLSQTKRKINGREYHSTESSSYFLPNDETEIDRLHDEHFITKELLGFNIMTEALKTVDFEAGIDVLDVCCGPATWLCETSLEYPNCHFAGIDMCNLWPQIIRPVNLSFTEANVLQGLPYPDQSFDFIQLRFVVLAFKPNEWTFILAEIKRVLKDGGCFQCIELDMKISTIDPAAKPFTTAFDSMCQSIGVDATIGAKLDLLLTEGNNTGMKVLQSEYREIPLGWGGPIGKAYLQTFFGAMEGLSPWLKQIIGITDHQDYINLTERTKRSFIQQKSHIGLYAFLVQKPFN